MYFSLTGGETNSSEYLSEIGLCIKTSGHDNLWRFLLFGVLVNVVLGELKLGDSVSI